MADIDPDTMNVAELRSELSKRGLGTKGNKAQLQKRLHEAIAEEDGKEDIENDLDPDSMTLAELKVGFQT